MKGPQWETYHTTGIKEKYLFRYMSLQHLFDFLQTGNMHLSRLDTFADKLEGIAIGSLGSGGIFKRILEGNSTKLETLRNKLQQTQKCNYASCWYLADRESIAMWELYAKQGLAIRFERSQFQKLIKSRLETNVTLSKYKRLAAGRVVYQNFLNDDNETLKYLAFRKDESFSHEREYRFVLTTKTPGSQTGLKFSLGNFDGVNFKIFASPLTNESDFEILSRMLKKISNSISLECSELKPWYDFIKSS